MEWNGKRVLVTGAGGFIGSHLAERLVELGSDVQAFVRYNSAGRRGWLDSSAVKNEMRVVAGDIADADSVLAAVQGTDIVFHLAALIGIPYSYQALSSYVSTNVQGTMNVLKAARHAGVERMVHTSSSEVYGTARYVPIDEDHPLQAQSPYSATKVAADKMAEAFHLSFGLPVVTIRPFNTYGARQSARAVIPTVIIQCMNGGAVKLGNLSPTRDLVHVSDTVAGFVSAGSAPDVAGSVINLGTNTEISIGDLAEKIAALMGTPLAVEQQAERVRRDGSEVERLLASNALAKEKLDWSPQHGLDEGLPPTIEWFRTHMDSYHPDVYAV